MRLRVMAAAAGVTVVAGVGLAFAAHAPEIDPATVPTEFFVAHNYVAEVPVSAIARAVKPKGTDVLVQHLSLGANQVFAWQTHPGPVVVTVRSGSLTYQDAGPNACRNRAHAAGEGFVDPGFGHVHCVIAGPGGGGNLLDLLLATRIGESPHRGAWSARVFSSRETRRREALTLRRRRSRQSDDD